MNDVAQNGPQPNNGKDPASSGTGPTKAPAPESKPANGPAPVSRAPLNLGGTGAPAAPRPAATPAAGPAAAHPPAVPATAPAAAPAAGSAAAPKPPAPKPVPVVRPAVAVSGTAERITGCKTFFTKLHPGAIDFLDEQITQWLKDNPTVVIKMTNTTVGEVQGKKNEPNILMTVWYHGTATKTMSHMG